MKRVTHAERIVDFLRRHAGRWFDDDELTRLLGIKRRQIVYQVCRQLAEAGHIRREKLGGKIHNSVPETEEAIPPPPSGPLSGIPSAPMGPDDFEQAARVAMSKLFGVSLIHGRVPPVPKSFDLVSPDRDIVGDAKFYTLVRGQNLPPAKFSVIAEHVWLLEKVEARHRFLVFGHDRRVPEEWPKRYGHLVRDVEFYFLDDNGNVERLD